MGDHINFALNFPDAAAAAVVVTVAALMCKVVVCCRDSESLSWVVVVVVVLHCTDQLCVSCSLQVSKLKVLVTTNAGVICLCLKID
jgi:hypothetical protein